MMKTAAVGPPTPCHRQRSTARQNCRDSSSDSEWTVPKEKQRRGYQGPYFTTGRAILFAAFCSSVAAVIMAFMALWFFAGSALLDLHADQLITTTSVVRTRFRPTFSSVGTSYQLRSPRIPPKIAPAVVQPVAVVNATKDHNSYDDGIKPHVAWLMSFPNSGTSFTLHLTRESSNATTATNYMWASIGENSIGLDFARVGQYGHRTAPSLSLPHSIILSYTQALEGEIRDKPSVPAIPGDAGSQGPWLELIPNRFTTVPSNLILTKTHCKGFCTGRYCGPEKSILTVRSFMIGCLSGTRAIETSTGLKKIDVTYTPTLVRKALHLIRHPLDNIVARFHLEYNVQKARGNRKYALKFPKNSTGFRRWCAAEDQNRGLLHSPLLDRHLRHQLSKIPCFADFFRYLQWHNLAFQMSHHMKLPTLVLHYHHYSDDFESTRDRVLEFLELPRKGEGIDFHSGKVYRNYYTVEQKKAIWAFLEEFSSAETWEQLKGYDFEMGEEK